MGERTHRQIVDAGTRVFGGGLGVRPPDDSSRTPGARASRRWTAICVCQTGKLSSNTSCVLGQHLVQLFQGVDLDFARKIRCRCCERPKAATTEPAAATWLSLMSAASPSPIRWLTPPPTLTAYFCSARKPGNVLRVSRISAWVPSIAATHAAVAVATPDRWHQVQQGAFGGEQAPGRGMNHQQRIAGGDLRSIGDPSFAAITVGTEDLIEHQQCNIDAATTPGSRATRRAVAVESAATVADVVTSGP